MNAKDVIAKLELVPLPEEGGFYKEAYRAPEKIGGRNISTCIYFLQTPEEFSALHLLKSATEIWHFYSGDPIDLVLLDNKSGKVVHVPLGADLDKGQTPQFIIPPNTWFGSKLLAGGKWGLVGCTVTLGFEFADFVAGKRDELLKKFPRAEREILQLTRS